MAGYLGLPRQCINVVYPGINLHGHGGMRAVSASRPFTVGYFARIGPEKGLHVLVDAFRLLKQSPAVAPCRLLVSGWLGDHQAFFEEQRRKLQAAGLADDFVYVEAPDHASKVRFFQNIDVLSVPTVYREPKGLYVLEAWANGVPVVQPRHGSFPELIEASGGGLLVEPENPSDLAQALRRLMDDRALARRLGASGQEAVQSRFHAAAMAQETLRVLQQHLDAFDSRKHESSKSRKEAVDYA
jgi:glycosyltransferase involved in cell wall biosynthesis